MYVKRAKVHVHLANFARGVHMGLLRFYEYSELSNFSPNLKKLSNGHTENASATEKFVCMPSPLARGDLCRTTFNAGNWWTVILCIQQHSGHRKKIINPENTLFLYLISRGNLSCCTEKHLPESYK